MTSWLTRRVEQHGRDAGAYAVLYATLVVVLLGMGAIVVDTAAVRQDRRLDRSAADSAAIGGAASLGPTGGTSPYLACQNAWKYLSNILSITTPGTACAKFLPYNSADAVNTYCAAKAAPWPAEIADDQVVGVRTIRVSWPIPYHAGGPISSFLTPEIAPGSVQQTFSGTVDGTDNGCDRLGVALSHNQSFGLGSALGIARTSTQVHSVARFNLNAGPEEAAAALNVLETKDCQALRVGGTQTSVIVGPTLRDSEVVGPGIIAVESDGSGTCGGTDYTMLLNGNGSLCASSVPIAFPAATNCDGLGVIRSHALDPGGQHSYNTADTTKTLPAGLHPVPTSEGGTYGWSPVTKHYGCEALSPCTLPKSGKNYISQLVGTYSGNSVPTSYYDFDGKAAAPYDLPFSGFTDVSAYFCPKTPTPRPAGGFTPGYYYISCDVNIADGSSVVFQGGTLVVNGGLTVKAGCFVMNATSCTPTIVGSGTPYVTTDPAPTRPALVFLRGGTFEDDDRLVMPQTFLFQQAASSAFTVKATGLTLWTAPGAGPVVNGHSQLEEHCWVTTPAPAHIDDACMDSRFARLAYWSEYKTVGNGANAQDNFNGQGALNIVGVFFTPRAYLNLTGGGSYTAAAAQFWANILDVSGNVPFVLSPDDRTAVKTPVGLVNLIR